MAFVVVTDDPGHPGVVLFMVDRSRQKKSFWSNRLTDVFVYENKDAAEAKSRTFKYGDPRVVDLGQARRIESRNLERLQGIRDR